MVAPGFNPYVTIALANILLMVFGTLLPNHNTKAINQSSAILR
jgi:hypothetical protein